MSFWRELKRRNVVKVAVAYAIVAWLLIQVADTLFPVFGAPAWVLPVFVLLLAMGFVVAVTLSWAYELTPEGIKRTEHVPVAESISHVTGQNLSYVVTGLLVLAVFFLVMDNYVLEEAGEANAPQGSLQPAVAEEEQASPNSIAVLPLDNLSPDPDTAFIAAGLHDEILSQLAKLQTLRVISRTSVLQYSENRPPIPDIARALNVETIMEGTVRYADDRIRVTVQLIEAENDQHVWSETYEREFEDIFAIESDIAMNVANALQAQFTEPEQESIEQPPTDSIEAYELYLAARGRVSQGVAFPDALESVSAALRLDPEFATAWALKALIHEQLSLVVSREERILEEQAAVLDSALTAIRLDPRLADAHALAATARGARGDWREAELGFRQAYALEPSVLTTSQYAIHLYATGHFDRGLEMVELARPRDPLNQQVRGFRIVGLAMRGDRLQTESEYDRSAALFVNQSGFLKLTGAMVRLDPARGSVSRDEIPMIGGVHDVARSLMDTPEEGLAAIKEAYAGNPPIAGLAMIVTWAAHFGDADFALDVMSRGMALDARTAWTFWLPLMRQARQQPRFEDLIRESGLVDYWNEFGWPEACRSVGGGDFECG